MPQQKDSLSKSAQEGRRKSAFKLPKKKTSNTKVSRVAGANESTYYRYKRKLAVDGSLKRKTRSGRGLKVIIISH